MRRHRIITATALLLALGTIAAACGDDDGADVRSFGDCGGSGSTSGSASASDATTESGSASDAATESGSAGDAATESGSAGSGSGSASCPSGSGSGSESGSESGAGSGSGIADDVAGSSTDNPVVTEAVAEYQGWVTEQVDLTIAATERFTDAVRAGDLEGARAAYAPSRQGWERDEHKTEMQTTLAELSEHLATVAGVLGLEG